MTKKDESDVLLASRLRSVIDRPEYRDTIGAWLEEERQGVLTDMATKIDYNDLLRAQGALKVLTAIQDRIQLVMGREEAILRRKHARGNTED